MAKIPLRAYVKEIENLIERGEIEQALSHARNILKTYPKHIDTYRLLGKAYLESQRYSEAADILQRVLSVIPDDFVSQLGMSIIREDEGNLDAAIFHMERAYEVQPFNPAVQDELRRLYGRRDGVEPPRIRLTRGALIRMYARGELYPQAIAEARAALAEDPQRLDLQVLLARLYYLSDQKLEAIEVCSSVLSKLPYCYEANLILAEILPGTSRADDAKKFQQRIYALQPYAAFISPSAQSVDQVPDQAVMLDMDEWDSDDRAVQTPEWTQNLGIEWEEPETDDLPDWLNNLQPGSMEELASDETAPELLSGEESEESTAEDFSDLAAFFDSGEPASSLVTESTGEPLESETPEDQADDLIPDWMKEAGWEKSDRSADEVAAMQLSAEGEQPDDETAAPAEIPDWLQAIAPKGDEAGADEEENLDWLESIVTQGEKPASDIPAINFEEDTPVDPDSLPDWLAGMETDSGSGIEDQPPAGTVEPAGELPEWLAGFETGDGRLPGDEGQPAVSAEEAAGGVPEWLAEIGDMGESAEDQPEVEKLPEMPKLESPAETGEQHEFEGTAAEAPEIPQPTGADLPEWMETFPAQESEPPTVAEETPAWLQAFKPEDEPVNEVPEWLRNLESAGEQQPEVEPSEEQPAAAELEPDELPSETAPVDAVSELTVTVQDGLEVDRDYLNWMNETSPTTGTDQAPPDLQAGEAAGEEAIPDWLSIESGESPAEAQELSVEEAETAGEIDTMGFDLNDPDAAMAWLEALAARQGADEETLITSPEERTAEMPDWLAAAMEQGGAEPEEQPEEPQAVETAFEAETEFSASAEAIEETPQVTAGEAMQVETGEEAVEEPAEAALAVDPHLAETAELHPEKVGLAEPQSDISDASVVAEPVEVEPVSEPDQTFTAGDEEAPEVVEPVEAETAEAMPDFSDPDAALAWLESLAARQGADEETLITPPEERQDTAPEWVLALADSEEGQQEENGEPQPVEEQPTFEPEEEPEMPAGEEEVPFVAEESAAKTEEEPLPDWLSAVIDESQPEEPGLEPAFFQPQTADDVLPTEAPASSFEAEPAAEELPQPEMPEDVDAAFAWLESLAARQGADESTLLTTPDQRTETETPDWLVQQQETEAGPVQEDAAGVDEPVEPELAEETPEEEELAQPETGEPEPGEGDQPPAGFAPAPVGEPEAESTDDSIPDWLKDIEEEVQAETEGYGIAYHADAEMQLPIAEEIASAWAPEGDGESGEEEKPEPDSMEEIQKMLMRGSIEEAIKHYNAMIQKGENLEKCIDDLRNALYRYPVDINIWQALGDAYAQNGQLQEAIDAYTKAEELLR